MTLAFIIGLFALGTGFGKLFKEWESVAMQALGRGLEVAATIASGFLGGLLCLAAPLRRFPSCSRGFGWFQSHIHPWGGDHAG
jgi:hypothetical protein